MLLAAGAAPDKDSHLELTETMSWIDVTAILKFARLDLAVDIRRFQCALKTFLLLMIPTAFTEDSAALLNRPKQAIMARMCWTGAWAKQQCVKA